tara:strand:+ start:2432 stop:2962 length:531 start_codon:yes stop_codon:yes gene_type:complete
MSICIISTSTNGFHKTNAKLTKKNIFEFARLISLNYLIGDIKDNKFVQKEKIKHILKPKCINFDETAEKYHGISYEKACSKGLDNVEVISSLRDKLKNVKHIISHNLPFHLKAIQVECFRTAIAIDFSRYNLIDTINFNHNFEYPKLTKLCDELKVKKSDSNLKMIKNVFLKLNSL